MTVLLVLVAVAVVVFVYVLGWALCAMAGQADREERRGF